MSGPSPAEGFDPQELLAEARRAAGRAYAPYSRLRVGAVAVAETGDRHPGANVENAAFPSTLCAEAVAIGRAVSEGARHLRAVAVVSLDMAGIMPCGQCRQRMSEFGVEWVIVEDPDTGAPVSYRLEALLPGRFGPWRSTDPSPDDRGKLDG